MKGDNKVCWLYDQAREILKLGINMELDLVTQDGRKLDKPHECFRSAMETEWYNPMHDPDGNIQSILITAVWYPSTDPHVLARWEREQQREQQRLELRALAAAEMGIHTMASTTAAVTSLTAASSSGGSG